MKSFERIEIHGYLAKDSVLRSTANYEFLSFDIPVSEKYQKQDGTNVEETNWYRCIMNGERAAKLAQYLLKGTPVMVAGKLKPKITEGNDGRTYLNLNLQVSEVHFLSHGKPEEEKPPVIPTADELKPESKSEDAPF